MKKHSKIISSLLITLTVFSCASPVTTSSNNVKESSFSYKNTYNGNVTVKINSLFNKKTNFSIKSTDFTNSTITKLKLEIIGNGIITPVSQTIDWTPGTSASFNLSVLGGKNRILILSGLNSNGNVLTTLMGAVDVNINQNNQGNISYIDTVTAQIILGVLNSNNSLLLNSLSLDSVKSFVTTITGYNSTNNTFNKINPSLVNISAIVNYLVTNNTLPPTDMQGLQASGTATFNLNVNGATVLVNDLSSQPSINLSSGTITVNNITPGKWQATIIRNGYKTKTVDISVTANQNTTSTQNMDNLFSNYISAGDSLTAGYQSGALQKNRQQVDYPILIAQAGGVTASNFKQPYLAEPGTGFGFGTVDTTTGKVYGEYKPDGTRQALTTVNASNLSLLLQSSDTPPFNNLGIPGATIEQMASTTLSQSNPYFSFILRNTGVSGDRPELQQIIDGNPSLLTLWIGNNDVLGAATSGNTNATSVASFTTSFNNIINQLLSKTNADIFVANIPDVTTIPYTSTIVTQGYADPGTNKIALIQYPTGNPNAPLSALTPIPTEEANVKYFLITTLTQLPLLQNQTISQIGGQYTLTNDEVNSLQATVNGYNSAIASQVASNSRLTLVDTNKFLKDIKNGAITGASGTSYLLDPNTSFSYDSVHPNSKGYTFVAQQFINAINKRYSFNLSQS